MGIDTIDERMRMIDTRHNPRLVDVGGPEIEKVCTDRYISSLHLALSICTYVYSFKKGVIFLCTKFNKISNSIDLFYTESANSDSDSYIIWDIVITTYNITKPFKEWMTIILI